MARVVTITPLWITQPWYPVILEMLENSPRLLPATPNLVILPTGQDVFIMKQEVPELVAWPISGNPLHHKEFLQRLKISSCPPGELRPSPTTTPCLPNLWIGVSRGIGILLYWPYRRCNQLLGLLTQGRISVSIPLLLPLSYLSRPCRGTVDGYPVGQHPLVARMLKGAFNERPPLPKYSSFWDVGLVLRYLKELGNNEMLSLRLTSIKSVAISSNQAVAICGPVKTGHPGLLIYSVRGNI